MKHISKFTSLSLGALLVGSLSFAQQTIWIDFNTADPGTAGANWNTIAAPDAAFASQVDLINSTGADSGLNIGTFQSGELDLTNTNMSDSGTDTGLSGFSGDASWVTDAAGGDYFFGGSGSNTVGFTITGLTAGVEYTVDLFASHSSSRTGNYTFRTVADANPTVASTVIDTFLGYDTGSSNTTDIMTVTFTAQAGEALQVNGFANSDDGGSLTGTRFNAVRIVAVPEPSTFALVGIALGSLLLFRRRKA
jgi:hypothetical protein